jgi:hypothetical protein
LARSTTDERRRSALLLMAQRWSDLAIEPGSKGVLDRAVQAHNERQMTPARVTQQQQQIQPKAEDTGD